MAEIAFESVSKVYGDGTLAVKSVSLTAPDESFFVLVGPSGCGKTTLLRMVAGLESITEGSIRIGSRVLNGVPAKERDIAMVFQNYALYPHMSAYDNIAFGLKMRKQPLALIDRRVRDAAALLGLEEVLGKKPGKLSGGQRQRVAMGRAIVREPSAFLMDEPLSNLDAKLRVHMRTEIARLQRRLGTTTIYVTHDQSEAMTLGDFVAVMRHGELQQLAPPRELFEEPANLFVAGFIGSPPMNLLVARLVRSGDGLAVSAGGAEIRLPDALVARRFLARHVDRQIVLGFRPEDVVDVVPVGGEGTAPDAIPAVIELREDLGREAHLHFGLEGLSVADADMAEADIPVAAGSRARCVARVSGRNATSEGATVSLQLDLDGLRFFDLETQRPLGPSSSGVA